MNNDTKVETAIAGLNCWASYATGSKHYKKIARYFVYNTLIIIYKFIIQPYFDYCSQVYRVAQERFYQINFNVFKTEGFALFPVKDMKRDQSRKMVYQFLTKR